ncbi:class I tRNA ligase family protein [Kribbella solani]|uniref:Methionyl-tRNA synthetase n=1 Tax=Kribbella solani TaxID=236067 RepID=A0A841DGE3_9ACTN|nr:methionyl-tRNA synthetase [Kribbella solani]
MTGVLPTNDDRPVLVLGPNPTPNGGMHLGHIAGPYLAGDVYARYQRARGRKVVFTTETDDSQTYVVASAGREGITPEALCKRSTAEIQEALRAIGISYDGFGPFDSMYKATVLQYFGALHAAGVFKLKTVRLPYLERTGEYMVEGLIEGDCPVCLASSRGGLCETCCHPNNFDQLLNPHSTINPDDKLTYREATIMVLPLEEYRERLTEYHERLAEHRRPHVRQMIAELLAQPLQDVPITFPLNWGIDAQFPEVPGQVLNAWLELIPAGMFTTAYAANNLGRDTVPGELWQRAENLRIVHFLGFDNAYYFCLPHIAMLMAHGDKYVWPESIINNEFYELESSKFSTSKRHVLTPQELLTEVPRDVARLYLALTAPEYQRSTFSRAGLDKLAEERLVGPWNQLAGSLAKAVANAGDDSIRLPVSPGARERVATMLERFDLGYEMPTFNLNRSAETVLVHIERLRQRAAVLDGVGLDEHPEAWGELFLEVKVLLASASPLLIDLVAAAQEAGVFDGSGVLVTGAYDVADVRPFAPPLLPTTPLGPSEPAGALA